MARTLIQNLGHGPATLPMPYSITIPPLGGVVVADDVPTVMGFIAPSVGPGLFKVTAEPDSGPVTHASGVVAVEAIAPQDGLGAGASVCAMIHMEFLAGVGGVADDVVMYDAAAPFRFEIEDIILSLTTGQAGSTAQLRDAKGGVGNVLCDPINTSASGRFLTAGAFGVYVPKGGTVVLRRSNNLIAGEIIFHFMRI